MIWDRSGPNKSHCIGESAAALGVQRGTVLHKYAIVPLMPQALGKSSHALMSTSLPSPFQASVVLDDDARFASRAMVILGPFARVWRRKQLKALRCLDKALDNMNKANCSCKLDGMAGHVSGGTVRSGISSPWEQGGSGPPLSSWPACTHRGASSIPMRETEALIAFIRLCTGGESVYHPRRVDEGMAEGPFTEEQLHASFGFFQWAPMRRFMHQQSCGKLRPIDDGRNGGHKFIKQAQ